MRNAAMLSASNQAIAILWLLLCSPCYAFTPLYGGKTHCLRRDNERSRRLPSLVIPQTSSLCGPHKPQRCPSYLLKAVSSEESDNETEESGEEETTEETEESESKEVVEDEEGKTSLWFKIKNSFKTKKEDDGLTFKQKLAKAGLSVALSYGWVSNMSYSVTVSLAWYIFSKQTGLSPLAPGQWKNFLAIYAGFYVFNNFIRPVRFALSAGVSRYFDNAVKYIERKAKVSRRVAVFLLVFLANFCGTLAAMSFGIFVASTAAGVPIFPPKA